MVQRGDEPPKEVLGTTTPDPGLSVWSQRKVFVRRVETLNSRSERSVNFGSLCRRSEMNDNVTIKDVTTPVNFYFR